MAKLTGTVPGFPKIRYGEGIKIEEELKKQEEALQKLQRVSDTLAAGELVGAIIRFQVADGYALYLVTKVTSKGVEVQHIPWCDGYQIPAAHMRGLTKSDILQQINAEKALSNLFKKKG
jgi:hypothetical protein